MLSNSRLAKYLIKRTGCVEQKRAMTSAAWQEYFENFKTDAPVTYFITEVLFDKIDGVLGYPVYWYNEACRFYKNRFKYHYWRVDTALSKNDYHESDERLLFANFQILVDFVEIEKAHLEYFCNSVKYKAAGICRDDLSLGISHLEWEITLRKDESCGYTKDDPEYGEKADQSARAQEVLTLYTWWKELRPNRVAPEIATGEQKYYDDVIADMGLSVLMSSDPRVLQFDKLAERTQEVQKQYDDEDEEMLIRLIKIRKDLWT